MNNLNWPENAIYDEDEKISDDRGKRVIVNSIGGALINVGGVVVWGPCRLWYNSWEKVGETKKKKPILKRKKFITKPYWGVLLDGYNLELRFIEAELS